MQQRKTLAKLVYREGNLRNDHREANNNGHGLKHIKKFFFGTEIYSLSIDISNVKGKNITLGTFECYNLPSTDKNNKQQLDNFPVETKS